MNEADVLKPLVKALSIISALDKRKAAGRLDEVGEAALQAAEAVFAAKSGRVVLAAVRKWQASGTQSFDPTPQAFRTTGEVSAAPPGRRIGLRVRT